MRMLPPLTNREVAAINSNQVKESKFLAKVSGSKPDKTYVTQNMLAYKWLSPVAC